MKKAAVVLLLFSLTFCVVSPLPCSAGGVADREVLSNGLTLIHAEKNALPIVRIVMAVKAGSIMETADKAGLSHLTVDLLKEGTTKRTSREISEALDFVGAGLGAEGGHDYITLTLSVLKKDLELGFDILSDIVLNPSFREEEVARRKAITKNSIIQQKEEPGIEASKAFIKAVFGNHPYSWPVEGTEESVDRLVRGDVAAFHGAWYAPNNAIMTVVGDVSQAEIRSLIEKYFGGWSRKEVAAPGLPELAHRQKPQVIRLDRALTQSNILLGHLGISRDNPDFYAVVVMNYILGGGGFASRLMDNIRDNRGLSYDVHSFFSAYKYGGSFQAGLQTKNQTANLAIEEIIREMERMRTEPVSDRELDDAKSYLTGSFPLKIDTNAKLANFLAAVEFYGLGLDYLHQYRNLINAVTREDVLRVAKKYLDPAGYTLVVVGDMKKADLKF